MTSLTTHKNTSDICSVPYHNLLSQIKRQRKKNNNNVKNLRKKNIEKKNTQKTTK